MTTESRPRQDSFVEQTVIPIDPAVTTLISTPEPLPLRRYFADGLILVTMAGGLELLCRIYGPNQRGFYCDDQSIRYPWKPNTISVNTLSFYTIIVTIITVFIVESYRMGKFADEFYSKYETGRTRLNRLIIRTAIFFGHSTVCMLIVSTLTTATKYPVGRLRPHFIDVCRPNIGYTSCNTTALITEYKCTSGLDSAILEGRLSFFSGHSSNALTAATFLCFYLQDRLAGLPQSRTLVPAIQTLNIAFGLFVGYTRIFDYWHHWTDVLVGCLVGISVTTILCKYYAGLAVKPQVDSERIHLLSSQSTPAKSLFCSFCRRQPSYQPPPVITASVY